jgi:metal-responsive CopG/Arc/MetJ family transcriptional regulator
VFELKIRVNYSIDTEVKQEFDRICKEETINKSAWIEQRIKEFIEQKKKEAK